MALDAARLALMRRWATSARNTATLGHLLLEALDEVERQQREIEVRNRRAANAGELFYYTESALEFAVATLDEVAAARDAVSADRDGQSEIAETYLASWFEAIDLCTARDEALDACAVRISELLDRRDALLKLVAGLSQTTPLASELEGWEGQRAALIAEIGTLRAAARSASLELEAQRQYAAGVEAGQALRRAQLLDRLEGRLRAIGALKEQLRTECSNAETEDQVRAEITGRLANAQVEIDRLRERLANYESQGED